MVVERKYNKPRILEALCEVRFATPDDWNTACYGMLMAAVRQMGFVQTEEIPTFALQVDHSAKETRILHPPVLMRYKHADGKKLLHLGPNSFTVNQLAPYTGWHDFKPYVLESLKCLHEALPSVQPSTLVLRYINRFEFTAIHSDIEKGFIRAEIVRFKDLYELGSVAKVKEKGLMTLEGKEYIVQDGDIINFRFNV